MNREIGDHLMTENAGANVLRDSRFVAILLDDLLYSAWSEQPEATGFEEEPILWICFQVSFEHETEALREEDVSSDCKFRTYPPEERDFNESRRGPEDNNAGTAPVAGMLGIHQHAHDPAYPHRAGLDGPNHSGRSEIADTIGLGTCYPIWLVSPGYE